MATEAKKSAVNEPQNTQNNIANANQTDTQSIKDTGKEVLGQVKDQVKERAATVIDEQKTNLTSGLTTVADTLRKVGEGLREPQNDNRIGQITAQYGEQLAGGIEKITNYFENADLQDIARDTQRFARQQPALFIGGAFVLGFLAARFLKTSAPTGGGRSLRGRNTQLQRNDLFSDTEGVHPV